jgi:hypothetical protein
MFIVHEQSGRPVSIDSLKNKNSSTTLTERDSTQQDSVPLRPYGDACLRQVTEYKGEIDVLYVCARICAQKDDAYAGIIDSFSPDRSLL